MDVWFCDFCLYEGIWCDLKTMWPPLPAFQDPSQTVSLTMECGLPFIFQFVLNLIRLYSADSG